MLQLKVLLDGTFIIENMLEPTRIIDSVEDPAFKPA